MLPGHYGGGGSSLSGPHLIHEALIPVGLHLDIRIHVEREPFALGRQGCLEFRRTRPILMGNGRLRPALCHELIGVLASPLDLGDCVGVADGYLIPTPTFNGSEFHGELPP
jgi:hypothetical protein